MGNTASRIAIWALGTLVLCASASCGGDDDDSDGSGGGGGSNGQCLDLAGSWTISQHCDPSQVGETFTVTQSGCSVTIEPFGFSGTLESNGSFTVTGNAGSAGTLTCTGTATSNTIDEVCEPNGCVVQLTR